MSTSTPASTGTKGPLLLDLPLEIRIIIFSQLLILAYPVHLYRDSKSPPSKNWFRWSRNNPNNNKDKERPIQACASQTSKHWLALLYSNRQLRAEASDILYSCNIFYLKNDWPFDPPLVISFLTQIGYANASRLSHMSVEFPRLQYQPYGWTGKLNLSHRASNVIEMIGQRCTHLKILEFHLHDESALDNLMDRIIKDPTSARQSITFIDHHLTSSIITLKKIYVNIGPRWTLNNLPRFLDECGWPRGFKIEAPLLSYGISSLLINDNMIKLF